MNFRRFFLFAALLSISASTRADEPVTLDSAPEMVGEILMVGSLENWL